MSLCPGEAPRPPSAHSSRLRCSVPLSILGRSRLLSSPHSVVTIDVVSTHLAETPTGFRWLHQWGKWAPWRIKQTEGGSVRLCWLALALMGPPNTLQRSGHQGDREPERGRWGREPDCQGPCCLRVPASTLSSGAGRRTENRAQK